MRMEAIAGPPSVPVARVVAAGCTDRLPQLEQQEHRHIDRHGPGWEAVTGGVDGPEGWPLYLDRYAALLTEGR